VIYNSEGAAFLSTLYLLTRMLGTYTMAKYVGKISLWTSK